MTELMGVKPTAFGSMTALQRGAFFRAVPTAARARCFANMRLVNMAMRQLNEKQASEVWGRLWNNGRLGMLRYAGARTEGFEKMSEMQRQQEFQRIHLERSALNNEARNTFQ